MRRLSRKLLYRAVERDAWANVHRPNAPGRAMTHLLETAFARASALPSEEQDALAKLLLAELDSEARWADLFARSPDLLAEMAAEAVADHRAGRTRPLDPDTL